MSPWKVPGISSTEWRSVVKVSSVTRVEEEVASTRVVLPSRVEEAMAEAMAKARPKARKIREAIILAPSSCVVEEKRRGGPAKGKEVGSIDGACSRRTGRRNKQNT